jgi:PAS domain S-box-containing protein
VTPKGEAVVQATRILNVDDDPANLYAKSRILRHAGFEVLEASLGNDALALVAAEQPDLVLLDVNMPDISGYEVCRRIKNTPSTASIVVIQLSASFVQTSDRLRGLQGGADAYLTEPLQPEELVANVKALLRLRWAEREVHRNEKEWQKIIQAVSDGVATIDRDGKILRCNPAFEFLLKAPMPIGRSIEEVLDLEAGAEATALLRSCQERRGRCSMQLRVETRWLRLSVDLIAGERGEADQFACFVVDETVHHQVVALRDALQEKLELLETLLRVAPVGIAIATADGSGSLSFNEELQRILGGTEYRPSRFDNPKFRILQDEREVNYDEWPVIRAMRSGELVSGWEGTVERHGELFHLLGSAIPLMAADGSVKGAIGAFLDISERKAFEDQLQLAKEAAEEANRAKDDFLATVSHELRTPMTSILGWAQLSSMFPADDEAKLKASDAILHAARLQAKLVDDLLDLSRISAGKVSLDLEPIELSEPLLAAVGTLQPAARAKGISIDTSFAEQAIISGDEGRLQQVFWNLLSNAVKFTPEGGRISIRSRVAPETVVVTVSDSGPGIASEFLPFVFDRFSQEGRINGGGLGIGLSIVREIVELHGGSISASSSSKEGGACFEVSLPLARAEGSR